MAAAKKPIAKPKSKFTGADITGQKYNTQIKEEAAEIRLKVRMGEKLTRLEQATLDADAAIKKLNTPSKKNNMSAAKKPMVPAKAKKVKENPVALPKVTRTKGKPAPLPKKSTGFYAGKNAALEAELKRQAQGKKPAKGYTYGKNVGP